MSEPVLQIMDAEVQRLANELASRRAVSITTAVRDALTEALVATSASRTAKFERLLEISQRFDEFPLYDDRSADEILGYSQFGLPE